MITLLKLGGSLVTDKLVESSFRAEIAARLSQEIAAFLADAPRQPLILGHGSGSFGHVVARKYNTRSGVRTPEQWIGFTQVAAVAAELNRLMIRELQAARVPAMRFQPSAAALSVNGSIISMELSPIRHALSNGVVPVVYGDVCFDTRLGGTITSTETIFMHLASELEVTRIFLLGEVDGVYDENGKTIPSITSKNLGAIESALGKSRGVDVTGGMETKVRDMIQLAEARPGLQVRIFNGMTPGLLYQALKEQIQPGTLITAG